MPSAIDLDSLLDRVEKFKKRSRQAAIRNRRSIIAWFKYQWKEGLLKIILVWFTWMFVGTVFYATYDFNNSFAKGFYFAVNVGYSIGDGVLVEMRDGSKLFSVFYLLTGALILSSLLATYIESFVNKRNDDFEENFDAYVKQQSLRYGSWSTFVEFFMVNAPKLAHVFYWLVYVMFGTLWSYFVIGWSFIDGLYFATSTLSTGGLQGIPSDSPDWMFFTEGLFACTGIPVMGMAIGDLASLIIEYNKKIHFEMLLNQSFDSSASLYADVQHNSSTKRNRLHQLLPQDATDIDDSAFRMENAMDENVVLSPLHTLMTVNRGTSSQAAPFSLEQIDSSDTQHQTNIPVENEDYFVPTFDANTIDRSSVVGAAAPASTSQRSTSPSILRELFATSILNTNPTSHSGISASNITATEGIAGNTSGRNRSSRRTNQSSNSLSQAEYVVVELTRLNIVSKSMIKAILDKYDQNAR